MPARARPTAALILFALSAFAGPAGAEEWSRRRIARLPDSAFAAVEIAADGRVVRHLPHHDESGAVDRAHLAAARARLSQVKWLDPRNAEAARRHLEEHWRELPGAAGRPASRAPGAAPHRGRRGRPRQRRRAARPSSTSSGAPQNTAGS